MSTSQTSSGVDQHTVVDIKALKLLKHERGQLRAALSRFETLLRENPDPEAIAHRMPRIEGSLTTFETVQRQISALEGVSEGEDNEVAEFEHRYDALLLRAKRLIRSTSAAASDAAPSSLPSDGRASASDTPGPSAAQATKLPPIPIPTFSGDYLEWENFQDLFLGLVHGNIHLSNSQRLHYLKGNLSGEALECLESFAVTDSNYEEAWQTLQDAYNNKRVLLNSHWKKFSALSPIAQESAPALKALLRASAGMQHALVSLDRVDTAWQDWKVFFITERLDDVTRRDWENSLEDSTEPPSHDALVTFLKGRIRTLEALSAPSSTLPSTSKPPSSARQRSAKLHHAGVAATRPGCLHCKGGHYLGYCKKLLALSVPQRRALVTQLQVCFNCLRPGHVRNACPSSRACTICRERHHSALCSGPTTSTPAVGQTHVLHAAVESPSQAIFATAIVMLRSSTGRTTKARVFLDPGAEISFISETTAQTLRLVRQRADLNLVGVGGSPLGPGKHYVNVDLCSLHDRNFQIDLEACVLGKMTDALPSSTTTHAAWPHLTGLSPLADPDYQQSGRIDVILGLDVYGALLLPDVRKGPFGSPTAQLTTLGWVVLSPGRRISAATNRHLRPTINSCLTVVTSDVSELLQRFWEVEEIPMRPPLSPDDEACEQLFASTHRRDSTGRYIVRLPLKTTSLPNWTDSLPIAINCLARVEKRCVSNPNYGEKYAKFLTEYAALGHMQPVVEGDWNGRYTPYYMPHHGVLRGDIDSGKLRVVFNASQKTKSGTSLNDHLLVGPTLQRDLIDVILSWRRHAVALTTDVEKMYRQVLVDERDADLQRIVWRREPSQPTCHFRLSTVTYGTACAPYLAIRTLMQLATDEQHRFPRAAEVLRRQSYVDDILSGADDVESALALRDELINLLRAGGFELRKWAATHPELLADFPSEWIQQSTSLFFDDERIKALGIEWSPRRDCFHFRVALQSDTTSPTKRSILSAVAKLFDPMGWIAPAIVTGKIAIQDLWLAGIDWDTPVPDPLGASWRSFVEDLPAVEDLAIPRWIGVTSTGTTSYQLHGFADASTRAYAAAVYLRCSHPHGATVSLLAAKTKVAPVKQLSIPRLELCAATLLARLTLRIRNALEMDSTPVTLWSDSQVVLAWIRAHASRWTTFVANRVSTVQSTLPDAQWRHVPTKDNPADLASRGIAPSALTTATLWWVGPTWLSEDASQWPSSSDTHATDLETRPRAAHAALITPTLELLSKFSNATKLWRVTAYCLRFSHNCRARQRCADPPSGPLTASELHDSRIACLKVVQAVAFPEEIAAISNGEELPRRSPLRSLRPFVDQRGVLRVGGRLQRSHLEYEGKHPAILPKRSPLCTLLIAEAHHRTLHGGTLATLNFLVTKYWVLGSKGLVRAYIHRCIRCCRLRASIVTPMMGNLPASRVTKARPFLRSGVDYAGPIQIRTTKGRGHKSMKGYIALFICLWSKAIHLEAVSDCSTSAFLAAFKRFTSRRGICQQLLSDNGSTFHGADAELRRMFNDASAFQRNIAELIANDGTTWSFIPPAAPHFGGLWEAGVRSTKHHLRRVIGETTLTYEELSTVLTQIEACLNSRPLTPLSADPSDFEALTPAHFLIGESLIAIPEPSTLEIPINRLSRWQLVTRMRDHFWHRWSSEYLHQLQQRTKWTSPGEQLLIGRLVLLKDERLPPTKWTMGRITDVHPGHDGTVRVVTVKTSTSSFKRPVTKLCPLPEQPSTPSAASTT